MVDQLIEDIDNLCFCYIHCNIQKQSIVASALWNLKWIKDQSRIEINVDEVKGFSLLEYIDYCQHKIAEIINSKWKEIAKQIPEYNEGGQIFVYTYHGLHPNSYNGKRVVFEIIHQNGDLFLQKFTDEINPDNNYGFEEFPVLLKHSKK